MSKEEFINYISYFEPQLNITVSEYTNDPHWVEIKLNEPKNNLDKIIVFAWKKYVIRLYDENDQDLEYNEYYKNFVCKILETKEEALIEICNIIAPEISNVILV
jgi:hydroxymethylpyrimidine pyrophosphatase-like HAD family hydrolase